MRKTTQFRYFGKGNLLNQWPQSSFKDGTKKIYIVDMSDTYSPIVYLGIQAIPGSQFYLNDNTSPIIIGASGIYQLDLTESSGAIYKLSIDTNVIQIIDNSYDQSEVLRPAAHLIIDIVYEGEEEATGQDIDSGRIVTETTILYNTLGQNTDGAITQAAITNILANKQHSIDDNMLIIQE